MLPVGVHKVPRKLAGGRLGEHWYAWRGGPSILSVKANTAAELERAISAAMPEALRKYETFVRPPAAPEVLSTLITEFLRSPDPNDADKPPPHLAHLSPRSMSDLRGELDVVREDLGELDKVALKADGARKFLLDWHAGYAAIPCTADAYMSALGQVLGWAKAREDIAVNPLEAGWPRLYKPKNHAEAIWRKPDLIRLLKGARPEFREAVLFSIFTGLRGSDAVRVTWGHVGAKAIVFTTGKSRGRRVITVPITAPLRALLAIMKRGRDAGAILTTSRGKPWSFSGLQTAMQRRKAALGLKGLRWHDLRGTAATRLIRAGLPVSDVALIVGWEKERVEAAAYYVTAEAVAEGMLRRLEALKQRR